MYVIRLTPVQRNALLSVLIDHSLRKDSTQVWVDVVNQTTVTINDLLHLLTMADAETKAIR